MWYMVGVNTIISLHSMSFPLTYLVGWRHWSWRVSHYRVPSPCTSWRGLVVLAPCGPTHSRIFGSRGEMRLRVNPRFFPFFNFQFFNTLCTCVCMYCFVFVFQNPHTTTFVLCCVVWCGGGCMHVGKTKENTPFCFLTKNNKKNH